MTEITRAAARAIIIGSAVSAPAAGVAFIRDWEAKKFRAFCERSDDDGFREAMTRMTFEELTRELHKGEVLIAYCGFRYLMFLVEILTEAAYWELKKDLECPGKDGLFNAWYAIPRTVIDGLVPIAVEASKGFWKYYSTTGISKI